MGGKSLINSFIKIVKRFGVDKAIFYTSLARIIQAFTGIVTIFFVANFLTGSEQGFYYTFGSILAVQVFFELGLNGIITQYVAHEMSHLEWDSDEMLNGSKTHMSRLSSLLHLGIKWYSIIAVMLFFILILTGFVFFRRYDSSGGTITWNIPWIILSFSTTISFLINPVLAFLEGLGKVKEVAKLRLLQQLLTTLFIWIGLLFGAKLFASGLSNIIALLVLIVVLYLNKYKSMLLNIWRALGSERVSYRNEIFPYQWKIALSWISGYFIFQLFNPVLFATEGAVVAGQMGMTLAALNGILSLSLSWMTTKVPLFSGLIAQKKYMELDTIFDKTLNQSILINGFGLVVLLFLIFILKHFGLPLGNRFLSYIPLILMMIPVILNQYIASWATYLRCHKQEPYLIMSVVGAVVTAISTIVLGKYFGVMGMTLGYCVYTSFVSFFWALLIFKTKKDEWHVQYQG